MHGYIHIEFSNMESFSILLATQNNKKLGLKFSMAKEDKTLVYPKLV